MKKSKFLKKSLAMLLALMLVVAMIPLSASAAGTDFGSIYVSDTQGASGTVVDLDSTFTVDVNDEAKAVYLRTNEDLNGQGLELRAKSAKSTVTETAIETTMTELTLDEYKTADGTIELVLYRIDRTPNEVVAEYSMKLNFVDKSTNTDIASVTAGKGIYSATVDNTNKQIKVVAARHTENAVKTWEEDGYQSNLNAEITVSTGDNKGTINGGTGTATVNADNGDTFTVTSESGTVTSEYTVVVTEYKDAFTSFTVNGVAGVISDENEDDVPDTITVTLPKTAILDSYGEVIDDPTYKVEYAAYGNTAPSVKFYQESKDVVTGSDYKFVGFGAKGTWEKNIVVTRLPNNSGAVQVYNLVLQLEKSDNTAITHVQMDKTIGEVEGDTITAELPVNIGSGTNTPTDLTYVDVTLYTDTTVSNIVVNGKNPTSHTEDAVAQEIAWYFENVDLDAERIVTVYAEDNSTQQYKISATIATNQSDASITGFHMVSRSGTEADVEFTGSNEITVTVPYMTFGVQNWKVYATPSSGAKVQVGDNNSWYDVINGVHTGADIVGLGRNIANGSDSLKANFRAVNKNNESIWKEYTVIVKLGTPASADVALTDLTFTAQNNLSDKSAFRAITEENTFDANVQTNTDKSKSTVTAEVPPSLTTASDVAGAGYFQNIVTDYKVRNDGVVFVKKSNAESEPYYELISVLNNDLDGNKLNASVIDDDGAYYSSATVSYYGGNSILVLPQEVARYAILDQNKYNNSTYVQINPNTKYNGKAISEYGVTYNIVEKTAVAEEKAVLESLSIGDFDDFTISGDKITATLPYSLTTDTDDVNDATFVTFDLSKYARAYASDNGNADATAPIYSDGDVNGDGVAEDRSGTNHGFIFVRDDDHKVKVYRADATSTAEVSDFLVRAENRLTNKDKYSYTNYEFELTWAEPCADPDILTFSINGQNGVIDGRNITVNVPYGTDLNGLVATFTTATGAKVELNAYGSEDVLKSGVTSVNYSSPVTLYVTAENGRTRVMYTVTVEEGLHFSDIDPDDWFYDNVMDAANNGYVSGMGDGTFNPMGATTRAQFASMIANALGYEADPNVESHFPDVADDHWAKAAINYCYENEIILGYDDGTFQPDKTITRQEAASILRNAFKLTESSSETFPDDSAISGWAKESVYIVKASGLMKGDAGTGNFRPTDTIIRAEAASILMNAKYAGLIK